VAAAAAVCYEISYTLQALEARAETTGRALLRFSLLGALLRRPLFAVAIALALAGYGLQVVALGLAPLTAVQPVLALGLVLLLFLGARVLHEPVGRREIAGVAVIVAAVAALALAAPERSVSAANGTALVLALAALGLLVALPFGLLRRRAGGGVALAIAAGAGDAWAALAAKLLSDELARGRPVAALCWAAGAGLAVLLGLTCELTALQSLPATRVAPVVLAMQIAVPVALAPAVAGESWSDTPLGGGVLVMALIAVTGAVALLGASPPVGDLLSGAPGSAGHQ
jgi:drug/metabolite transporter (DMT)-like permease